MNTWKKKAVIIIKEFHKVVQKLEKKAYKKKSYYYNLKKSIAGETPMLVISEDFALMPRDQDLSDSEEKDSVNEDKVKAREFAKQGEEI